MASSSVPLDSGHVSGESVSSSGTHSDEINVSSENISVPGFRETEAIDAVPISQNPKKKRGGGNTNSDLPWVLQSSHSSTSITNLKSKYPFLSSFLEHVMEYKMTPI